MQTGKRTEGCVDSLPDTSAGEYPESSLPGPSLSQYIVGSQHIYFLQPLIIALRNPELQA